MKSKTAVLALGLMIAGVSAAPLQDPAALIEKLRSKDKDEADNARADLLQAGPKAIQPLRDAEAKAADAESRKLLGGLANRLETRQAAAGIAKAWGDRWYATYIGGLHVGWAHLKTEEKDGNLILTDELHFQFGKDTAAHLNVNLTCARDEYLGFSEVSLKMESPDRNLSVNGRVKEGRLVVKTDDKTSAVKLDGRTVPDTAFLRLVTVLPRTGELDLTILQLIGGGKPRFRENSMAKFDKEESIEFEGKKVKVRRYLLTDGEADPRFYFVDAEGRLLRIQFRSDEKDVEISLSDEKRARDIDTKD